MAKPGRKGIDYSEVVRTCKELEEKNIPVTIRKVLDITGGSFSTVASYVRRWQEATAIIRDAHLPDELITALKLAFNKMLENERKTHQNEMMRERNNLEETLKQVVEFDSEVERLNKEIENLKQHYQDIATAYEKKLAAAESRVLDSEKREKELNDKLESQRQAFQQAQIQVAIMETKCQEYEKQLGSPKK